jgi:hypothetical protein
LVGVVLAEGGLCIDAVVYGGAYAIVVGREGEDLDLVVDGGDALYIFDGSTGLLLDNGPGGVALEDEGFTLDAKGDPVEDGVIGETTKLFPDRLHDAEGIFLRRYGTRLGFLSQERCA